MRLAWLDAMVVLSNCVACAARLVASLEQDGKEQQVLEKDGFFVVFSNHFLASMMEGHAKVNEVSNSMVQRDKLVLVVTH